MTETLQWIDADGATTTLDAEWEVSGRFMPPIKTQVDEVPGQPGGLLRSTRHGIREFVVAVWQQGAGETGLRTALRAFVDKLDPIRGPGKLRVTSPLGDQREITCSYAAGLEMEEKLGDSSGPDSQKIPLAFTAFDPYWYDPSPTSETFSIVSVPSFFPIFPIKLTASELVVDDTVTNNGSVETWPVWTITGPGTDITLRNLTTGLHMSFGTHALGAGESLVIDTRPGRKSVTLQDGTNAYAWLDWTVSSLWSLKRGMTSVRLEMAGVIAGQSSLQVSYWQRYLSP